MTRQTGYRVRWKGKETGPHTVSEIRELLDIGEFGLMHEVHADGEWITLRRFLETLEHQPSPAPPSPAPVASSPAPTTPIPAAPLEPTPLPVTEDEDEPETGEMSPYAYPLIAAGYLMALAALLLYPQYIGFAALMLGAINAACQRYLHGGLQMVLALICGYIGMQYTALLGRF